MCVYIYIYRERERERVPDSYLQIFSFIIVCHSNIYEGSFSGKIEVEFQKYKDEMEKGVNKKEEGRRGKEIA